MITRVPPWHRKLPWNSVPHIPMDYQWIFSTIMPIWAVSKSQNWLSCWLSSLFRHPFAACVLTCRERSKVHNFYKSFPKSCLKLLNLSGPFPMSQPGVLDASKGTLLWRFKRFCTRSKSNSQTQRTGLKGLKGPIQLHCSCRRMAPSCVMALERLKKMP